MKDKIFSVLQRVGRSFMLPIAILPVAGLLLGIGSSFTNETTIATYGLVGILGEGTILHSLLVIMNKVGSVVFDNLPLIFAVGVAIGMAKKEKEVAALSAVIAYFVITDLQQEDKLTAELQEISNLVNSQNIDIDQINERLDRTVTRGDYAVVEQSFKQYLKDNFDVSMKIADILNDEKLTTILTADNYKQDGKDFVETKNYISTTRDQLETYKTEYKDFFTEDKVMSYINDKNLDSYYTDLYKQELVGDIESDNETEVVESAVNDVIGILDTYEEVINFLVDNQNSWNVQDDTIEFTSESLQNQYNSLIDKLS